MYLGTELSQGTLGLKCGACCRWPLLCFQTGIATKSGRICYMASETGKRRVITSVRDAGMIYANLMMYCGFRQTCYTLLRSSEASTKQGSKGTGRRPIPADVYISLIITC